MSAEQLTRHCWVDAITVKYEPSPHCHIRADVRGSDGRFRKAALLGPCWVVTCDGRGIDHDPEVSFNGELRDSDEGHIIHAPSRAEAEQAALTEGWVLTRDGRAWCPACAPSDLTRFDLAVVEEVPGQMALIGGDAA